MIKFKNKLLFLFGSLFMAMVMQAQETKTISVVFSDFTSGSQYADNEQHDLGGGLVIYTTDCHFTTELRIYSSSTFNGFVISDPLPGHITQMRFNAAYVNESDKLNVFGSSNGNDWTLIKGLDITTSSYKDYVLNISADKGYTCFRLDVSGDNQIRVKSMSITYIIDSSIVQIDRPTLPASCSFIESMMVEITNNMDGATIYYTTDGILPSVDNGNVYTAPFTITETTTVKAVAVKEEGLSDVAEATYTKIEDYYQISFSVNGTIDADNDIFMPYGGSLTDSSLPDVELPKNIKLKGWSRNMNSTETIVFPMIDIKENLTLYAVFEQVGYFELVTDASALTEGDRVAIACPGYSKVISTSDMIINNVPCAVSTKVEMKDDALIPTEDTRVFVLHKNSDDSFIFEDGGKFLTCPEDENQLSMQQTSKENKHLWTVTIADRGVATIKNNKYSRTVKYNSANPRFACYTSGQKPVSIYREITPTTISTAYTPLQIFAVGYSTMYLDKDVAIPINVEAYLATEVGDGYIVMTQHRGLLPKETGIILKGDEGKYAFMHSEATAVVKSLLKGTLSNEYVSGGGYVLSVQDGVVGLYAAKLFDGKFLNNANKAYLPASVVPKELQSNGFRISVGSETCINRPSLEFDYLEGIYDLQGRKVLKMEKGIYILNGKKVLVK